MAVRWGNAPFLKELVYVGAEVSLVKVDKDIRLERLKNEPEKMDQYLEFVFSEADVSVVIAVNYDTIRLERWKNTPERMEEHRKLKKGSAQKAFLSGAEHIKSKKILRQTSSCTTKEIEQEPEAEQVKTREVSHLKSKATSSSRTK